jgi:hypothetical protein
MEIRVKKVNTKGVSADEVIRILNANIGWSIVISDQVEAENAFRQMDNNLAGYFGDEVTVCELYDNDGKLVKKTDLAVELNGKVAFV